MQYLLYFFKREVNKYTVFVFEVVIFFGQLHPVGKDGVQDHSTGRHVVIKQSVMKFVKAHKKASIVFFFCNTMRLNIIAIYDYHLIFWNFYVIIKTVNKINGALSVNLIALLLTVCVPAQIVFFLIYCTTICFKNQYIGKNNNV